MSDVDRLREAADSQDDFGEGAAIAALLRAVADEKDRTGHRTWYAAVALADSILGER